LADFCSDRAARTINMNIANLNRLTSGTQYTASLPMRLSSDRETFEAVCSLLAPKPRGELRATWIRKPLALEGFLVSEPVLQDPGIGQYLQTSGPAERLRFDLLGNLADPFTGG
jgi:hypothetical protein